jgi:hypothetical protein
MRKGILLHQFKLFRGRYLNMYAGTELYLNLENQWREHFAVPLPEINAVSA